MLKGGVAQIKHIDYLLYNTSDKVTFENAYNSCKLVSSSFALVGSQSADLTFLNQTFQAVHDNKHPYVWVGGYFNLSSDIKLLAQWTDGSVTDPSKSPSGVWCHDPKEIIEGEIQKLKAANGTSQTFDLIIPIVRTNEKSHCLTLYTQDLLWPNRSVFPSLCLSDGS